MPQSMVLQRVRHNLVTEHNTYILFHILFHFGLSWDTDYSSLCYTVGSYCLSEILFLTRLFQAPLSPLLNEAQSLGFHVHCIV